MELIFYLERDFEEVLAQSTAQEKIFSCSINITSPLYNIYIYLLGSLKT